VAETVAQQPTLAEQVARFALDHPYEALPQEVSQSVKMRVLDILGICLAASELPTSVAMREHARSQGGAPEAHAVGVSGRVPAPLAALVNGTLAHSLDYDDTHLPSVLHPSASVVPAALATAEANGRSGAQVIAAIAAGLEVCVRLGMVGYDQRTRRSIFFENGQHATSICGTVGAAVAAGVLCGLDDKGLLNAIGLSASMGSGIIEANRTGGTVKRMHCGWAAQGGITAAVLARRGFSGPPTVFEGRFGFFQAWLRSEAHPERLVEGLGETWEVPRIFFKPYPANHFTHAAVDAAATLRARGLDWRRVTRFSLGVAASVLRTVGEPIEIKRAPQTGYMAQFSGPYAVAAGILGGSGLGVGLEDYSDQAATDPLRRQIMAKVDVVADPRCSSIFPDQFPCILRATLDDGREEVAEVLTNRGGPDRPLTYEELAVKFADNAGRVLPADKIDRLKQVIAGLENLQSLEVLMGDMDLSGSGGHTEGLAPGVVADKCGGAK